MMGLTPRQRELLAFLQDREKSTPGVPPSLDEMREHLGFASRAGAHRLISKLEDRGVIRRARGPSQAKARAIEVVKEGPPSLSQFGFSSEIAEALRATARHQNTSTDVIVRQAVRGYLGLG